MQRKKVVKENSKENRFGYLYLMQCLGGWCGSRNICYFLDTGKLGYLCGVTCCRTVV